MEGAESKGCLGKADLDYGKVPQGLGCMLNAHKQRLTPDGLADAGEHASRLNTRLRYRVYYVEKCSSTQDLARELAEGGAAEGTVVVAEEQERGRGRLGRSWFSGKGGLWFTVILRPGQRLVNLLSLAVGVSVARALRSIGLPARLKWPNDVVIEGKKVGGILVEAFSGSGEEITALVGIGLNVNNDLPEELAETSASLKGILGRKLPRLPLLMHLLEEVDGVYTLLVEGRGKQVIDEWKSFSDTLGKAVKVVTQEGVFTGVAVDVGPLGELYLKTGSGEVKAFYSGDVIHLR